MTTECKIKQIVESSKNIFENVASGSVSISLKIGNDNFTIGINKESNMFSCNFRHASGVSFGTLKPVKSIDVLCENIRVIANTSRLDMIRRLFSFDTFEEFKMDSVVSNGLWILNDLSTIENAYRDLFNNPIRLAADAEQLEKFVNSVMNIHWRKGIVTINPHEYRHIPSPVALTGNNSFTNSNSMSLSKVMLDKVKVGMYDSKNDVMYHIRLDNNIFIDKITQYKKSGSTEKLDYEVARYP